MITTHGRVEALARAVAALQGDANVAEVVVVADGAADATARALRDRGYADDRVRCVGVDFRNELRARQTGARHARSKVIVFLDDDVVVEPSAIERHVACHSDGYRGRVVVGYMPVALGSLRRRGVDALPTKVYAKDYERRCADYRARPSAILEKFWAGNFSMLRADCLEIGIDATSFVGRYHADRDFGLRCLARGFLAEFVEDARANHWHSRTLKAFEAEAYAQGAARVLLHELWYTRLGSDWRVDVVGSRRRSLNRSLESLARRRRLFGLITATVRKATRVAGRLRLDAPSTAGARVLRRCLQLSGAIDEVDRALLTSSDFKR